MPKRWHMTGVAQLYQTVRQEVAANWKTGVVMTGVAVIAWQVHGVTAAVFVGVFTITHYELVGRQIRIFSWMSLRKMLIAFVVFGNAYYNLVNPQIVGYVTVALLLIDNFQLASINEDLSTQKATLEENNRKLQEAYDSLKQLQAELKKLVTPVAALKAAEEENQVIVDVVAPTIPEIIRDLPNRLQDVNTLLHELLKIPEMKEQIEHEKKLRDRVAEMLQVFRGVVDELRPLTERVDTLSSQLATTAQAHENNVTMTKEQVKDLKKLIESVQQCGRVE